MHMIGLRLGVTMIKAVRRLHLTLISILTFATSIIFIAAIGSRQNIPINTKTSSVIFNHLKSIKVVTDLFKSVDISVEFYQHRLDSSFYLQLKMNSYLNFPDKLLYISTQESDQTLPDDAVLLGNIATTQLNLFQLPEKMAAKQYLIIYSLGHQRIVNHGMFRTSDLNDSGVIK